jgi:hypothetical protein
MHLLSAIIFAGLAAAAPNVQARAAPDNVQIRGVSLLGSGCPKGSADVQVDATGTLFEVTFSEYHVQTGPGTQAADWRKNCKLTLNMEFDSGFQFTVVDTTMSGFAQIPKGAKGQCKNTFTFTGSPSNKADYSVNLKGQYSGDFTLRSDPSIASWSPCEGSTAILNMNSQCNLSPTNLPSLIEVRFPRFPFHVATLC